MTFPGVGHSGGDGSGFPFRVKQLSEGLMRNTLALLFLAVALCACAAAEPHPRPAMLSFTQPRDNGLSDEQAENFFEGEPAHSGALIVNATPAWPAPTPPNLR